MKRKPKIKSGAMYQLLGWILFILCALCYLASSIKSGDYLVISGNLLFLGACFVFVVPLLDTIKSVPEDSKPEPGRAEPSATGRNEAD